MGPINIFRTIWQLRRHLAGHPLTKHNVTRSLLRFGRYQIAWRAARAPTIVNWVGGTRLIIGAGMRGVTGEAYLGVNEFSDVLFVGHLLRRGDLLLDVGANVGSYSILAAKVAGAHAIAVEPIPETVQQLEDHIRLNRVENLVEVAALGVSDRPGELWFTGAEDALNHVTEEPGPDAQRVTVTTIDALLGERKPTCIKIDVEQHELAVIEGAKRTLSEPSLHAVLLETGPKLRTESLRDTFSAHGLHPHRYDPFTRQLTKTAELGYHNTLFVRDTDFASARVRAAPPIHVGSRAI